MEGEAKKKILLVDDEKDFLFGLEYWLKSKGYEVTTANDGLTGIELVKSFKPDLVFLDINMPGIDGVETLKRIREFNSDIPAIIISAFVENKKIDEAATLKISGIFSKDRDFEEGLFLIQSALKTHKKLKEEK